MAPTLDHDEVVTIAPAEENAAAPATGADASAERQDPRILQFIEEQLLQTPSATLFPALTRRVMQVIRRWEADFNQGCAPGTSSKSWSKVTKRDGSTGSKERAQFRVVKEFNESAPVLDRLERFVTASENLPQLQQNPCTIVDLCSGFGILGMLCAELLPKELVESIVLVDKMWPEWIGGKTAAEQTAPTENQIGWEHVYFRGGAGWPIRLRTSKRNLKKGRELEALDGRLLTQCGGPVLVCAIHLCGSLSLRATQIFNVVPNISFLALKPCCLPGRAKGRRDMIYQAGGHVFSGTELYNGEPEPEAAAAHDLQVTDLGATAIVAEKKSEAREAPEGTGKLLPGEKAFSRWNTHLLECLVCEEVDARNGKPTVTKSLEHIRVQERHFQNKFLFSARPVAECITGSAESSRARVCFPPVAVPEEKPKKMVPKETEEIPEAAAVAEPPPA